MLFNHHQFYSIKKQLTTKSYLNDSNDRTRMLAVTGSIYVFLCNFCFLFSM